MAGENGIPELTPEEFASWLTPQEALEALADLPKDTAKAELLRRLRAERARAGGDASRNTNGRIESYDRLLIMPAWWSKIEHIDTPHNRFWLTGGMTVTMRDGDRSAYGMSTWELEFFGVKFEPVGVFDIPGARKPELLNAPPDSPATNRGRPKFDFWEDLWAEIAAQLASGKLVASKQADIERAMLDWASANDKPLGEPTARLRASKLWKLILAKAIK